jgi:hypothetical protein
MLLYRLNIKVVDLPYMAGARDKSDNLSEKDSLPVIAIPDDCYKGVIICKMQTEYNLG